jgi:hypothetical protein
MENKNGPKGILNPLRPSHWILLESLLHRAPKKVRGQVLKLIEGKWEPTI